MNETKLTVDTSHDVLLTKSDRFFAIREMDWTRLKRLVGACNISIEWWSIAASVCFSIAGSAIISVFTLVGDSENSTKIIVWGIFVASLIIGIVCVIAAIGRTKVWDNQIEEVRQTITDIETMISNENE